MIVIKKVTVLGQKKRKKENIILTARWNGFLLSKLYEAGIQVDREMQVPKIRGFMKADLQNSLP